MNLLQKFKNWYNTPNRAKVSLRNILAVIQAWYRKNDTDTPQHIIEQQAWRMTKIDPICKINGYCKECGCSIDEKTWEDRSCSNIPSCYPEMMSKEIWKDYKSAFNVKL